MKNKYIEVFIVLMFLFLIGLVFVSPSHAAGFKNDKEAKIYLRYFAMGQQVAEEDYKHYTLWQHYEHKMHETLKQQAYREGYLDRGAYLAMPMYTKIEYNIKDHMWIETHILKSQMR